MNLDELQTVQARERQSSDLQYLRSSFYREVGEFINDLIEERAGVVEAAEDPFSEPEVRRLTDDIETAEGTVEAIYERRVGKVVKKASIAAAGMPIEDEGLTSEEEALFEDLVDRIERNRETVLSVLDGEAPTVSCSIDEASSAERSDPSPEDSAIDTDPTSESARAPDEGLSAADLMGDGSEAATEPSPVGDGSPSSPSETTSPAADPNGDPDGPDSPPRPSADSAEGDRVSPEGDETSTRDVDRGESDANEPDAGTDPEGERTVPGVPRTTVRITADVGEIVGADDRDYDLGVEDVVSLPEPNADVLVEKDAAERLR